MPHFLLALHFDNQQFLFSMFGVESRSSSQTNSQLLSDKNLPFAYNFECERSGDDHTDGLPTSTVTVDYEPFRLHHTLHEGLSLAGLRRSEKTLPPVDQKQIQSSACSAETLNTSVQEWKLSHLLATPNVFTHMGFPESSSAAGAEENRHEPETRLGSRPLLHTHNWKIRSRLWNHTMGVASH